MVDAVFVTLNATFVILSTHHPSVKQFDDDVGVMQFGGD